MARYYRTDRRRNLPASTEITGYAASAFVYLHSVTKDARYLDRALAAARFLARAWDPASQTMPFEIEPAAFAYFFDCGIVVRGLLSVWRATGEQEFLDTRRRHRRFHGCAISPAQRAISIRSSPCPPERPCRAIRSAGRAPPPATS